MENSRNSNTQPDSTNSLQTGEYDWSGEDAVYDTGIVHATHSKSIPNTPESDKPLQSRPQQPSETDLPQEPTDPMPPTD